ncbi:MAG: MFS transporter [Luteimonas sp.]
MLAILRNTSFHRLYAAQIVALLGTGLATVALALLAYELAGPDAGAILGTALAIKMAIYVLLAPLAGALVPQARRKAVLVALDIIRAGVVLALPFVTEIWQIYVLIALLQSGSAAFTPLFQSLIPEILPQERDYTRALSLSRLAYDLENLLSPAIAAALLTMVSFHGLFVGTSVGFVISAILVVATTFPSIVREQRSEKPYERARRGMRIYMRTPRLRGLLALSLTAAAGGAMVIVNTVVIVRSQLQGGEQQVAWALAAFGGGSMLVALLLPRVLDRLPDRRVMTTAATVMIAGLLVTTVVWLGAPSLITWPFVLGSWAVIGMGYAGLVTPSGRLLRRSAGPNDLTSLFAAQFSLSHACWLIAYPLAGWLGALLGLGVALAALSGLALVGLLIAYKVWPADESSSLAHSHPELPDDHPHVLGQAAGSRSSAHEHAVMIDDLQPRWPG